MKGLLFACRVAFILNLLFVVSFLGRMNLFTIQNDNLRTFIVTAGIGLALIVNAIVNTVLIVRVLRGIRNTGIPAWLINANFIFLVFQIVFFFI